MLAVGLEAPPASCPRVEGERSGNARPESFQEIDRLE